MLPPDLPSVESPLSADVSAELSLAAQSPRYEEPAVAEEVSPEKATPESVKKARGRVPEKFPPKQNRPTRGINTIAAHLIQQFPETLMPKKDLLAELKAVFSPEEVLRAQTFLDDLFQDAPEDVMMYYRPTTRRAGKSSVSMVNVVGEKNRKIAWRTEAETLRYVPESNMFLIYIISEQQKQGYKRAVDIGDDEQVAGAEADDE